MSRPTHAVVSLPALDLRTRPDHRAEMGSQLLAGECVRLLGPAPRAGWWHVRAEGDGYEGWAREWGLVPAPAVRVRTWRRLASAVVAAPHADVTARPDGGVAVGPLFLGSIVIPGARRGSSRAVELPDGRRGWVVASALRLRGEPAPSLVDRITSLLGAPYLWGGRTCAGLDCSALTQLALAEQGVALPRDAADQFVRCARVPDGAELQPGDLAFFAARGAPPGHVGLALGNSGYAHCRGRVQISSLDPDNPLCDSALLHQFRGWYRPRVRVANRPGLVRKE